MIKLLSSCGINCSLRPYTVVVGYDSIADPTVFGPSTIPTGGALTLTGTYSDPMIAAARAAEFPWIFRW